MTNNQFLSDDAIKRADQDFLNRANFAERLADSILTQRNEGSLVVGLYAPWGAGKTSVLNLINARLEQQEKVIVAHFNPWQVNSQEEILKKLFLLIGQSIGEKLKGSKETVKETVDQIGGLVKGASSILGFPIDISGISKAIGDTKLEDLKNKIFKLMTEWNGGQLVIIIDDIDRLDKDELFFLFKTVKLTATFPNTVYLLSMDDKMVAKAITKRFSDGDEAAGEKFLEKIVQVPVRIPKSRLGDLGDFTMNKILDAVSKFDEPTKSYLSDEMKQVFISKFRELVLPNIGTPRMAIRYVNAISLTCGLVKDEVNHLQFLLCEALKIFFAKEYEFVKNNPDWFLMNKMGNHQVRVPTEDQEKLRRQLRLEMNYSEEQESLSIKLLKFLFPNFRKNISGNQFSISFGESSYEKSISQSRYFDRYFSYNIAKGELADADFDLFLLEMEALSEEDTKGKLLDLIYPSKQKELIHHLYRCQGAIVEDWEKGKKLIRSLCLFELGFWGNVGEYSERSRVYSFIHDCFKSRADKVLSDEDFTFLEELLSSSFKEVSWHIFNWIKSSYNYGEQFISERQLNDISVILMNRYVDESGDPPFYIAYEGDSNLNKFICQTMRQQDSERLSRILEKSFEEDSENRVKSFLRNFENAIRTNGRQYRYNLESGWFEEIKGYTPSQVLLRIINHVVDIDSEEVVFFGVGDERITKGEGQTDLNLLRQFKHFCAEQGITLDTELADE
ncbi:KAP family P-loop NTPase fold protein [Persicobacter diffluens]|uniref:KAP NTPase domain-containing protein n=1 Tax=Persicobacter diffluens TaxID=981 RepID=A0AAN5AJL9_9BACT|nr:hypothetical protein PEDI_17310 [Persicobacter diffluens]